MTPLVPSDTSATPPSRREFIGGLSALGGLGLTALGGLGMGAIAGCGSKAEPADSAGGRKKLKALCSNAGLTSSWCRLGKETMELWGKLLDVDVHWVDGGMNLQTQRDRIEIEIDKDWDFCCFQAVQIDSLEAPARRLKKRGIPVVSMDTLLVSMDRMRDTGVWIEVTPDHVFMGESSVRYLMEKIGGKGKVIHIGGLSAHSGAQGRKQGFENIVKNYPEVEVVGGEVRWCDWEKEKALNAFESFLNQESEKIAGAFFHSDDMALACVEAAKGTPHEGIVITAVDGQKEGLAAVESGKLAATTVNPVCLIHMTSLVIGQFIARGGEKVDDLPLEIITPGPLVSLESGNLAAMKYLADPKHCLV